MNNKDLISLFNRLKQSKFRGRFVLNHKKNNYLQTKGLQVIAEQAAEFILTRLAPAHPINDGKQTPWHGHPVFIAQHATATCCRQCLYKWHYIKREKTLTSEEQQYVVNVIMHWLKQNKDNKDNKNTAYNLSLL